jgi:hypothetical protein
MTLFGLGSEQPVEVARIIERDELWYVDEKDSDAPAARYRPFEAPFRFSAIGYFRYLAGPWFVDAHSPLKFEGTEGSVASLRLPPTPIERANIERGIAQLRNAIREHPDGSPPSFGESVQKMQHILDEGVPVKCDTTTGMMIDRMLNGRRVRLLDFQFLPAAPDAEFDITQTHWADHSAAFTDVARPEDLILFQHSFSPARNGKRPDDVEGVMLDMKSGEIRRIPFRGLDCMPRCFLPGRKSIVVAGADERNLPGLFTVDLTTGLNTRIGGAALRRGVNMVATPSPDGNTLLVVQMGSTDKLMATELLLLDLKTDTPRTLVKPGDWMFPNWLPDGSGLVCTLPILNDKGFIGDGAIKRIDLEGNVTPIRDGRAFGVIKDRILFLAKDDRWFTCDLDGKNEKLLGDGLEGLQGPSFSPDGTRIVMSRSPATGGPAPVIVELNDGSAHRMPVSAGFWQYPIWR